MDTLQKSNLSQGSSAGLERWSHKPEVGGSSPPFDTITPKIYPFLPPFVVFATCS